MKFNVDYFALTLIVCLSLPFKLCAQTKEKVKIVLLGTVHLTPSAVDVYKNKAIDLHTEKKQNEIREIVNKIAAFNPDQICLEYPMENQSKMDSIYSAFKSGNYTLKDNERDLLGIQTAKILGLKTLTCINYYGKFNVTPVTEFASAHGQNNVMKEFDEMARDFVKEIDYRLSEVSLKDFLIYVNSDESLMKNLSLYTKYYSKIGKDKNYAGADLVADWYSTNVHIYANILRIIKPTDKRIVVIFGQGHIPILKHLFTSNNDFEILEVSELLK